MEEISVGSLLFTDPVLYKNVDLYQSILFVFLVFLILFIVFAILTNFQFTKGTLKLFISRWLKTEKKGIHKISLNFRTRTYIGYVLVQGNK